MLIPNHPDEERLSALASHDADATADRSLTDHVTGCDRCSDVVTELGALRTSLAGLPDLAPSRPLRLVPGMAAERDRASGWARRLFGPLVTTGAALAFVGLVGTALPALNGMAASGGAAPLPGGAQSAASAPAAEGGAEGAPSEAGAPTDRAAAVPSGYVLQGNSDEGTVAPEASAEPQAVASDGDTSAFAAEDGRGTTSPTTDDLQRSIWPMLLFAGVALVIGALLMRWILAPRAG
ncbi:MAG TPA: hypothetical protein VFW95_08430 [Candidatus Limnocylindria bacterium]|nr:hypothetical protein [Candidatus Limnocylindria bacterium]